jgi:hypothetical protein
MFVGIVGKILVVCMGLHSQNTKTLASKGTAAPEYYKIHRSL